MVIKTNAYTSKIIRYDHQGTFILKESSLATRHQSKNSNRAKTAILALLAFHCLVSSAEQYEQYNKIIFIISLVDDDK